MNELASALRRVHQGDPKAAEELLPLVYHELRKLAAVRMAQQPPGQTLQATALVHEAWLKLTGRGIHSWNDRKHFMSAAAEAMRQILIDRARRKQTQRHGGGCQHLDAGSIQIPSPAPDDQLIELSEALEELAAAQPAKAEVVKLKFFAGLTDAETAEVLGVTERTIQRYWSYAQVWLLDRIRRK